MHPTSLSTHEGSPPGCWYKPETGQVFLNSASGEDWVPDGTRLSVCAGDIGMTAFTVTYLAAARPNTTGSHTIQAMAGGKKMRADMLDYKFMPYHYTFVPASTNVSLSFSNLCSGDVLLDSVAIERAEPIVSYGSEHGSDADGSLRLVGGRHPNEGRVEVFYNGEWGTVCDDLWDENEAAVVCRQLGLGDAVESLTEAFYGEGSGRIWMDNVLCEGSEAALSDCTFNGWGIQNCGHMEDAGVRCTGPHLTAEDRRKITYQEYCMHSNMSYGGYRFCEDCDDAQGIYTALECQEYCERDEKCQYFKFFKTAPEGEACYMMSQCGTLSTRDEYRSHGQRARICKIISSVVV